MVALSAGTDDIVAQSGITIAAPDASFIPAAGIYTNQTVTYNKLQLQVEYRLKSIFRYLIKHLKFHQH